MGICVCSKAFYDGKEITFTVAIEGYTFAAYGEGERVGADFVGLVVEEGVGVFVPCYGF